MVHPENPFPTSEEMRRKLDEMLSQPMIVVWTTFPDAAGTPEEKKSTEENPASEKPVEEEPDNPRQ